MYYFVEGLYRIRPLLLSGEGGGGVQPTHPYNVLLGRRSVSDQAVLLSGEGGTIRGRIDLFPPYPYID